MEKYIDLSVWGITKTDFKKVLKESGLKKRLCKRDFSDGEVSVDVKEMRPYLVSGWRNYSLGISSDNIESAAKVYNLILEKTEGKRHIESNLHTENKIYSGTGGFP